MEELTCPYCEEITKVEMDFAFKEDFLYEHECSNCEKMFVFNISVSYNFWEEKADCLNGAEHDFQKIFTVPKAFTRMRCSMCGTERDLTDEERVKFGIPTKEEYFKEIDERIAVKNE